MRVLEFHAENFGPHADVTVQFAPGLTAITGPNGSGKSTIADGLYACLTGDFPGEGTQEENVRAGTPKKGKSQIRLTLTHAGTEAVVTRRLAPSPGRELIIGGEKKGRTQGEVNDALLEFLGTTKAVLTDYAFVRQWEAFGVLTAPPAKRLAVLTRLFGVDGVDRAFSAVTARLAASTAQTVVSPERLAEAEQRLAEANARLFDVTQDLAALPDADWCARTIRNYSLWFSHHTAVGPAERELEAATADVARSQLARIAAIESYNALSVDYERGARRANELSGPASAARQCLLAWHAYRQAEESRSAVDRRRTALRATVNELSHRLETMPETTDELMDNLDAVVVARQTEADTAREAARLCDQLSGESCPLCRNPLTADYQQDIAAKRAEKDRTARALTEAKSTRSSTVALHAARKALARDLDQARRDLAAIVDPPHSTPPDRSETLASADIAAYDAACTDRQTADTARIRAETVLSAAEADFKRAHERLARATAARQSISDAPPAVPEAEYTLALSADSRRPLLERSVADARRAAEQAIADRNTFAALVAESAGRSAADAHLRKVREVLRPGPGGLTSAVVDHCLEALVGRINERLEEFSAPFTVALDAQASFTATFPDGAKVAAGRLSGGQKMILALAFRLSVLAEYGGDLGFLCLDEPTVGLDTANRGGLARCLAAVGRWAAAGDAQLVVITHDPQLAAAADTVIKL